MVSKFKDLRQTAVRGAKVWADLVLANIVPQLDAKKWRNPVPLVPTASVCCTCVPTLLPLLPENALTLCLIVWFTRIGCSDQRDHAQCAKTGFPGSATSNCPLIFNVIAMIPPTSAKQPKMSSPAVKLPVRSFR